MRFVNAEWIVDGASGPDKIHLYKKLGTNKFYVRVNHVDHGPFRDAQKMIAFGGDGDDHVEREGKLSFLV